MNCSGYESPIGMSKRAFLEKFGMGVGVMALAGLSGDVAGAQPAMPALHRFGKAKRIIYLFQAGGPSQLELFDYKPTLNQLHGTELPDSIRKGQRLTAMSGNQASLPLAGTPFRFEKQGECGTWMSEILPFQSQIADDICVVNSMHTEAINHGPGVTMMQTGSQFPGRPSMGAWLSYGLGTENSNLPAFVVMVTRNKGGQPLVSRLWGSGFLPSQHQGVRFRAAKDPVLYLNNPDGISVGSKRAMLDALRQLHELQLEQTGDRRLDSRIAQHELAFRMQQSIPEATNIESEPQHILDMYGKDATKPGTFAANCLLARRMAERGVRFIQLYHQGWDQHGGVKGGVAGQCRETDQASAALVMDLKQRGMLEDTLVVWGGEFGRTNYCQGKLNGDNFGRDHHPRCYSMWLAGGGIRGGMTWGQTDEFGYNVAENGVHVHDLHATILHLMGIDHEQLTYRYQGRRFRLTDVHGEVVRDILA